MTDTLPDYDELDAMLRAAGASASPAEAHGVLAGVLCAPEGTESMWSDLIFDDPVDAKLTDAGTETASSHPPRSLPPAAGARLFEHLTELLAQTRAMLTDPEFGFAPLLPGETESLPRQLEGLTDWCRGFLLGFSAVGDRELRVLSPEAREFLEDVVQMSDVELEADGTDAEGEAKALAELVEYLRVGVQLLYDERDAGRPLH